MSLAWCPRCGRALESASARCPEHDVPAAVPVQPTDPFIGRVIDERFTLEARIGAGGMGTVYRAAQRALVRPVAVKIVDARWTQSPDTVRRFLREAHTLSRISHPSVVSVLDFGQSADGVLWLAMELVAGRTLGEVLAETPGGMPHARAIQLAIELTWALEAAHAAGIVHRDLKPSNVMILDALTGRDFIKVLDFGIARPVVDATQMTATGKLVGTPQYLAPEVLEGEVPGPESDIYALGIILYELLVGRAPFTGSNLANVMYAQVHTPPPPLPAHVPAALARVVEKLLVKDPTLRPRSAATVRALLESAREAAAEQQKVAESRTEPTPVASALPEHEPEPHDERTVATAEIGRRHRELSQRARLVPVEVDISVSSLVAPLPGGRAPALEGLLGHAEGPTARARPVSPEHSGPSPHDFAATERSSLESTGPTRGSMTAVDATGPTRGSHAAIELTGVTQGSRTGLGTTAPTHASRPADPAILRGITAGLDITPPAAPDALPTVVRPEASTSRPDGVLRNPADGGLRNPADGVGLLQPLLPPLLPLLARPAMVTPAQPFVAPVTPPPPPSRFPWRALVAFAIVMLATFGVVRWTGSRSSRAHADEPRASPPPVMAVPAPAIGARTSTAPR